MISLRRFLMYTPNLSLNSAEDKCTSPLNHTQAVGVVMPSGKCVVEWQTAIKSVAVFENLASFIENQIHGYPKCEIKIVWLDTDKNIEKDVACQSKKPVTANTPNAAGKEAKESVETSKAKLHEKHHFSPS